jgi:hypothetical protein
METFHWMEKNRRGSGTRQRGHNLATHQARLADAGDHSPAPASQEYFYRPHKVFIQAVKQALDGFRLNLDDFFRVTKDLFQRGFPKKNSKIHGF